MFIEPTPSLSERAREVAAAFTAKYGTEPAGVWAAPGRVNLIGEHTDYNEGFVMPFALPYYTFAAAAPGDAFEAESVQFPGHVRIESLVPGQVEGWTTYPAGVLWAFQERFEGVGGLRLLIDSDVPSVGGLSSSAALQCATAFAVNDIYGTGLAPRDLALLAQYSENTFVGVPCGCLDQMASVMCRDGHALFLDTRSLAEDHVPFDPAAAGLSLVVVDTRAPHRHVDGEYAMRRNTCAEAAGVLGVPALRDLVPEDLDDSLARLTDEVQRKRVRHVVTEDARVLRAVDALREGRWSELGLELTASHASMRDDYEITVPELDVTVEAALEAGALGARMTGGGFGGCAIALTEDVEGLYKGVTAAFAANGFEAPRFLYGTPSAGAQRVL